MPLIGNAHTPKPTHKCKTPIYIDEFDRVRPEVGTVWICDECKRPHIFVDRYGKHWASATKKQVRLAKKNAKINAKKS